MKLKVLIPLVIIALLVTAGFIRVKKHANSEEALARICSSTKLNNLAVAEIASLSNEELKIKLPVRESSQLYISSKDGLPFVSGTCAVTIVAGRAAKVEMLLGDGSVPQTK
jgi:hypothetical protein